MIRRLCRTLCRRLPGIAPLCETRCAACATPVPFAAEAANPLPLCPACATALARREGGYCPRCGNLTETPHTAPTLCGPCLVGGRPWERFIFHGAYQGLLRTLILRYKNGHELPLGKLLGELMTRHPHLAGTWDAIIPMPLHPQRLRQRGFNQALEAARPLAATLGTPLRPALLSRAVHTHPQAGLSLKERKTNVQSVFTAANVAGLRILLVDDVATTCASLESATRELAKAGAASIDVAVIARTPQEQPCGYGADNFGSR